MAARSFLIFALTSQGSHWPGGDRGVALDCPQRVKNSSQDAKEACYLDRAQIRICT